MKITTWNVNSLNVRLPHVIDFLSEQSPDILVLQELKMEQEKFPAPALNMMGWHTAWAGQKTYNGVAIISKTPLKDVQIGLPDLPDDPQQRVITATIQLPNNQEIRIIDVYCVNGESLDSPKFIYKRQWFSALNKWVESQLKIYPNLVLLGDFNIAPTNHDVYDPIKWHEQIHCSSEERSWFNHLLNLGLTDSLRQIYPENNNPDNPDNPDNLNNSKYYTWFDYRGGMFPKKLGLRIDHILISQSLTSYLTDVQIDLATRAKERPSDHAPVTAIFKF